MCAVQDGLALLRVVAQRQGGLEVHEPARTVSEAWPGQQVAPHVRSCDWSLARQALGHVGSGVAHDGLKQPRINVVLKGLVYATANHDVPRKKQAHLFCFKGGLEHMPRFKRSRRTPASRTSWSLVPRAVWEIIAGCGEPQTLTRLRRVCAQFRKLLAAWDVLDFDCGVLAVPMCVGARLLTFELDDDLGALSKGHLLLLAESAPNLESLSAAFGADIFVENSILQRFAKLRALSVWHAEGSVKPRCFPVIPALRTFKVPIEGSYAESILGCFIASQQQLETLEFDSTEDMQDLIDHCGSMTSLQRVSAVFEERHWWSPLIWRLQDASLQSLELVIDDCSLIPSRFVDAFPLLQGSQLVDVAPICESMRLLLKKDSDSDQLVSVVEHVVARVGSEKDVAALNSLDVREAIIIASSKAAFHLACQVCARVLSVEAPEHVRMANLLVTGAKARRLCLSGFHVRLSRGWQTLGLEELHVSDCCVTGRKPRNLTIECQD